MCAAIGDHKGHSADTIGSVAAAERKELEEKLIRGQEVEKKLLQKVAATNEALDSVSDGASALKDKIEAEAALLIQMINDHRGDLLQLVEARAKEKTAALTAHSSELAQALNTLRAALSHVQAATGPASSSPQSASSRSSGSDGDGIEAALGLIRAKASLVSRVESAEGACLAAGDVETVDWKAGWSAESVSRAGDTVGSWAASRRSALEAILSTAVPLVPSIISSCSSQPFSIPYDITCSSNLLFVSDPIVDSIFCFRTDGSFVRNFGSKGSADGQLILPCLGAFEDGSLYVSDRDNKRICVFGADGTFRRQWALPFKPLSLTYYKGLLFITDNQTHRIHAYRRDGTRERSCGSQAESEGRLQSPSGVSVSGDHVFVANNAGCSVSVFATDGRFIRRRGSQGVGPGQLMFPTGVAVYRDHVLVADTLNHRICVFSLEGAFLRSVGSKGSGPDQFSSPRGIVVMEPYALIVDSDNKRIRCIRLDSLL